EDAAAMGMLAERLRVRKERAAGAGEVGWDVFSLHYNPAAGLPAGGGSGAAATPPVAATSGGPLSALFTPTVMLSYNRLARLLWRLKRAEHALSATWGVAACGLQRMVDKMGADGHPVQPVLALLLRLRSEMSHFATNLQYYIQFEVMEASWQDFYARAAACADLDSLISAHEAHLATLLRKALLATDTTTTNNNNNTSAPAANNSSNNNIYVSNTAGGGGDVDGMDVDSGLGAGGGGGGGAAGGPSATALRRALQDALTNMVALRAIAARLEETV
ncbi:hypothetical protein Agub_g10645, partial [Astrephomene gubernaculifera]